MDIVIAATTGRSLPAGFLKVTSRRRAYEDARIRLLAETWVAAVAATTDEEFARVESARRQLRDLDARTTGRAKAVAPAVLTTETFLMGRPAVNRKASAADGRSEDRGGAEGVPDAVPHDSHRQTDAIATPVWPVLDVLVSAPSRTDKDRRENGQTLVAPPAVWFGHSLPARRSAG